MHDVMKNVTSIFDGQHTRRARYEYAPFGSLLTTEGDMAQENKFRFSCEFSDDELGWFTTTTATSIPQTAGGPIAILSSNRWMEFVWVYKKSYSEKC